jgi:hypothetical protein
MYDQGAQAMEVSDMPINIFDVVKVPVNFQFESSTCVKGTRVALLFLYLHRPARQGEVFASLFVKPPTTGAASAKSYDLYSRFGVLRILSRNYAYRRRVEIT